MLTPYKIEQRVELIKHGFDIEFHREQLKNSQILASVTSDWNRYKQKHNELHTEE